MTDQPAPPAAAPNELPKTSPERTRRLQAQPELVALEGRNTDLEGGR